MNELMNNAVWHADNVYSCSSSCLIRKYSNKDFIAVYFINETEFGTIGYVGYSVKNSNIVVAFKGDDLMNQVVIDSNLVSYPACDNCQVNKVFGMVEGLLTNVILQNVLNIIKENELFDIIITGHGFGMYINYYGEYCFIMVYIYIHIGGAIATLIAVSLRKQLSNELHLITFGSLRVGNAEFAIYASNVLTSRYRVTHKYDPTSRLLSTNDQYTHLAYELYYEEQLHHPSTPPIICNGYEDMGCSYQWEWAENDPGEYLQRQPQQQRQEGPARILTRGLMTDNKSVNRFIQLYLPCD